MKKKYNDRTDIEKLRSQWTKLTGLHGEQQWSAAVVRAATAAEIATNIAIRSEFGSQGKLTAAFVDSQLKWANGIAGKFKNLLIPLTNHIKSKKTKIATISQLVETINRKRNDIVHRGEFCSRKKSEELIDLAKQVIEGLLESYEPNFVLDDPKSTGDDDK